MEKEGLEVQGFNKFTKQKQQIMILGVSEWLSGKLGWKTSHIRIAFVLAVLFAGFGVGLYLILWLVKMFSK
ncbi:MAG: PspC domain-containing protein [Urechidicola sp.]